MTVLTLVGTVAERTHAATVTAGVCSSGVTGAVYASLAPVNRKAPPMWPSESAAGAPKRAASSPLPELSGVVAAPVLRS